MRPILLRFDNKEVIAKRFHDGGWINYESYEQCSGFPFDDENDFVVEFTLDGNIMHFSIDDKHFCDYKMFLPTIDVTYVQMTGSVRTHRTEYIG